jgi:hypothetical protein
MFKNFLKPDICFGSYRAIFRGLLSLKLHLLKRLFHWFTFRQGFFTFSLLGMHRHYLLFVLKYVNISVGIVFDAWYWFIYCYIILLLLLLLLWFICNNIQYTIPTKTLTYYFSTNNK